MNRAKFKPYSYKKNFPKEKYIPRQPKGLPVQNELLQFLDCLVSVSYSDNIKNRKVNHIESEIGTKLIFAILPTRNIEKYKQSWLTLKDLSYFCIGYSERSIRKGATWLVKKGLFKQRTGAHNKAEYKVHYVNASYKEIAADIARQRKNNVKNEDIVFIGIRYLTSTHFKKDRDRKAVGNFTYIPFFLPRAKSRQVKEDIVYDYYRNPIFDSIDGNTLKVILKLIYLISFNQRKSVHDSPETEVKVATLMKLCGLSKNKVESALKYLKEENFLRSYNIKRNSRKYIFNIRMHRYKKVNVELEKRKHRRSKNFSNSFTVLGQIENRSLLVLDSALYPVLPSQGDYNKDSFIINIQKLAIEHSKEETEKNNLASYQNHNRIEDMMANVQKDLLLHYRMKQISYLEFLELNKTLLEMKEQNEKIQSLEYLIESYNKTQVDPSKQIIIGRKDIELELAS